MKLRHPNRTFRDRSDAGRAVAQALLHLPADRLLGDDGRLVLGLARGGVPVAAEVAEALDAPLDVFVVRKLGVPQWTELAMGALASGGIAVHNDDLISRLGITPDQVQDAVDTESVELTRRETTYRGDRAPLDLAGKTVILVDDGVATGASVTAACTAVRAAGAGRVVVAVPVGPPSVTDELASIADDVVCVTQPPDFAAVGQVYADFRQVTDGEVQRILAEATKPQAP